MGPSRQRAGFTLIEMMVVVTIIGISIAAFAPSFSHSMADRRCATASMELVRMGRRARAESIGLQRAFLVHIEYGMAPNQTARMRLLRANTMRCDVDDWAVHAAACPTNEVERGATACMESIDLASSHWYKPPYAITVGMWTGSDTPSSPDPNALVQKVASGGARGEASICYEPSGTIRWTVSPLGPGAGMLFSTLNAGDAQGGGLMFATGLVNRSTQLLDNVARVSLFPLAGTPRRMR
jgi:prepilin-type N-terminal cleavage/methylation domain-containing protein